MLWPPRHRGQQVCADHGRQIPAHKLDAAHVCGWPARGYSRTGGHLAFYEAGRVGVMRHSAYVGVVCVQKAPKFAQNLRRGEKVREVDTHVPAAQRGTKHGQYLLDVS